MAQREARARSKRILSSLPSTGKRSPVAVSHPPSNLPNPSLPLPFRLPSLASLLPAAATANQRPPRYPFRGGHPARFAYEADTPDRRTDASPLAMSSTPMIRTGKASPLLRQASTATLDRCTRSRRSGRCRADVSRGTADDPRRLRRGWGIASISLGRSCPWPPLDPPFLPRLLSSFSVDDHTTHTRPCSLHWTTLHTAIPDDSLIDLCASRAFAFCSVDGFSSHVVRITKLRLHLRVRVIVLDASRRNAIGRLTISKGALMSRWDDGPVRQSVLSDLSARGHFQRSRWARHLLPASSLCRVTRQV